MASENDTNPKHYTDLSPQPIEIIEAWGLDYHLGNVLKYIARSPRKGEELEDLRKAIWYLQRKIMSLEPKTHPFSVIEVEDIKKL